MLEPTPFSNPIDPVAPPLDLTGLLLGDFQILRKIGQGGMGQVYLARQLSLKRDVALKILRDDLVENSTALKRFQAEAEAVAKISHPNIVQVYAVGAQDGLRYMALEYVNGRNLREYLDRKGPPELPLAIAILKQVAVALQRAAEVGLVHRDIKPENILLNRKAEVKVADFGLSRYFGIEGSPPNLTQSGMTLGTPLYMSPEQVQGQPADQRSDLYSLGVTAYHLLAGQPPFRGATAFEVAAQHVQNEAEPLQSLRPDLPSELCELVHKLMAKNPENRFPTAKDVARELGRIQKTGNSQPIRQLNINLSEAALMGASASRITTQIPVSQPKRWWRIAAFVFVLGAVGLGGWLATRNTPPINDAPASNGLPFVQLPIPLTDPRETTFREQIQATHPHDRRHYEAVMSLGLLYISERRLEDAERLFKELEALPAQPGKSAKSTDTSFPVSTSVLARLGSAIVLAHLDTPNESNREFELALNTWQNRQQMRQALEKLCLNYPEFGHAIADAVNRNAENLPKGSRLPVLVGWLRNPSAVLSGPK
jgi:eukaryotic-like serine/threonine-protein kinase